MRAFISVEISEEIKKNIVKIQNELFKQKLFDGKLTEPENLHLTLKFLGEISEKEAGEVQKKLKEINFKKFNAKISEIGVFSPSFIKIIWVKIDGGEVMELQKEINDKLSELFAREVRFMSHLTIARVKNVKDKKKLLDFLASLKLSEMEFLVNSFELKKSELTEKGPIYSTIEKFRSN